ncbi:hypothetical protein [Streptomyces sp. SAJ15]|nr:hypothetical protein [Streptomyces sp. SAJ15]
MEPFVVRDVVGHVRGDAAGGVEDDDTPGRRPGGSLSPPGRIVAFPGR